MNRWKLGLSVFLLMVAAACSTSESEEQEMRTVEIAGQSYEVPEEPERIVTDFYAGEVLTVGRDVVGSGSFQFDSPFLEEGLADAEDLGDPVNVEAILELDPDLIIVMYDDNLEQLQEIAPTVYIPYNTGENVEDTTRMFGELLNAEDEAEAFLDEFDEKAEAAREEIDGLVEEGSTFGIYEITEGDEFYVFGSNFGRGGQALYYALGLDAPEIVEEEVMNEEDVLLLSREVIPDYAADYMFVTSYDPEGRSTSLSELQNTSIWQGLDAVQNDRYVVNDFDTFYPYDPISVSGQIDLFVNSIREMNEQQ